MGTDYFGGLEMDESLFSDEENEFKDYLSLNDAYLTCLNARGSFDMEYIKEMSGLEEEEIISGLEDIVIQDPEKVQIGKPYSGFVSKEEYLSGDVVHKLKVAQERNHDNPNLYANNIALLKSIVPSVPDIKDIYFRLGTSWIPAKVYWGFANYLFHFPSYWDDARFQSKGDSDEFYQTNYGPGLEFDQNKGVWDFLEKDAVSRQLSTGLWQYRTNNCTVGHLFLSAMNGKTVTVTVKDKTSSKKNARKINLKETTLANEIIARFKKEFIQYVYSRKNVSELIASKYYERFCTYRQRHYDGSYLTLPGINPIIPLRKYQKDSVAQILQTPNTLLAHDVGYGKTYTMIASCMELRRLNISRKNLFVIPSSTDDGWRKQFKDLYPNSDIVIFSSKDFTPKKRKDTLLRIQNEDHDAYIIPDTSFTSIRISKASRIAPLNHQIQVQNEYKQRDDITERDLIAADKAIAKIQEKIDEIMKEKDVDEPCFEDLKINTLFVDEAHEYKNITLEDCFAIRGVNPVGSHQADDMLFKARIVQTQNDGRGVIFATATPLVNSISEVYTMEKFLHPGTLKVLKLESFNAWLSTFAEVTPEFEVDSIGNSYKIVNRLRKFHNLRQLSALLSTFTSFAYDLMDDELPTMEGYQVTKLKKGVVLDSYVKDLEQRAEDIRNREVDRKKDNYLSITVDGRMAALDTRLVDYPEDIGQIKLKACADNVAKIYHADQQHLDTQIIFCDLSTPKKEWNVYEEMQRLLIQRGVKNEEIAFIQDAKDERQRKSLFDKVNDSQVRVLLGSTWKCGIGVNIQTHLKAVHHLDIPWRPADITQREGRMMRQGNLSENVSVFRYVVEGTFDAHSWQILETKQKFIEELLSGVMSHSEGEDIGERALSYGEVKALAIGNALIKERVTTYNQLEQLKLTQSRVMAANQNTAKRRNELPSLIATATKKADDIHSDYLHYASTLGEPLPEDDKAALAELEAKFTLMRKKVSDNILNNADVTKPKIESKDEVIGTYHGFDIMVYTTDIASFYLKRNSVYTVEWKDTGSVTAMKRYLGLLDRLSKAAYHRVEKLQEEQRSLIQFASLEDHQEEINRLELKLASIDQKLELETMKGENA